MADVSDLERAVRERGREIRDRAMLSVEEGLAKATPVGETGRLRDEISVTPFEAGDTVGCRAESPTEYAEYVDQGTPPHDIFPRNAKALRFEIGGTVVFAKVVHHPGYKPTVHFFSDTVEKWPAYLREAQ